MIQLTFGASLTRLQAPDRATVCDDAQARVPRPIAALVAERRGDFRRCADHSGESQYDEDPDGEIETGISAKAT